MRGAERPSKVQWTHPFLHPLTPLTATAAHQTFIEIADDILNDIEIGKLLDIMDNIPLAVQLVAAIAASEGGQATLQHWNHEKTTLLSGGYDKHSNLEISITLSLTSPRMLLVPHAVELLSLMSLLSDGISDSDLAQSKPPIPDILKCKATLVRTSLAYVDRTGRLKVLAPIREYIQATRPPSPHLVRPLRRHLSNLVSLWTTWLHGSAPPANLLPQLVSNLGNLDNLLLYGLDCDPVELGETIQGVISLNCLNRSMNRGYTPLMLRLPEILAKIDDHNIHGLFITEAIQGLNFQTIPDPEQSIAEATEHFRISGNVEGEGKYCCLKKHL
jgi:hypothetical protein